MLPEIRHLLERVVGDVMRRIGITETTSVIVRGVQVGVVGEIVVVMGTGEIIMVEAEGKKMNTVGIIGRIEDTRTTEDLIGIAVAEVGVEVMIPEKTTKTLCRHHPVDAVDDTLGGLERAIEGGEAEVARILVARIAIEEAEDPRESVDVVQGRMVKDLIGTRRWQRSLTSVDLIKPTRRRKKGNGHSEMAKEEEKVKRKSEDCLEPKHVLIS